VGRDAEHVRLRDHAGIGAFLGSKGPMPTLKKRIRSLQRGQVLRGAGLRVQFAARRLRLLDFEVFFFGTAIVVVLGVVR